MLPGKQYTPEDVLRILRRRWWLLLLPLVVATGVTISVSRLLPDFYRSDTLILIVPQRVPESYVRSTVTARIEDRLQSISQQILSRTRLERIIQDFNLYTDERRTGLMEDVVEQMRRDIEVQIVKGDAFRVAYTSQDPRTAMRVTERLSSLFIDENLRDREVLAEGTSQFMETQLDDARRRLIEHENKLEEYREQFSGQLPTQLQSNLQALQNIQMQIQQVAESLSRDRDRQLILERALADVNAQDGSQVALGAQTSSAAQLDAANKALLEMSLRLKPEHPDVLRMKRVIADLEKKAAAESSEMPLSAESLRPASQAEMVRQNRIRELHQEQENVERGMKKKDEDLKQLQVVAGQYQARIEAAPKRETELIALTRDYTTLQGIYTNLLAKKEDSKMAANLERRQIGEQFKILDQARMPERPFKPNRMQINLLGSMAGLGLGVVLVGLLEYRDTSFRLEEDVVASLTLPVLAVVESIATAADQRRSRRKTIMASLTVATIVLVGVTAVIWKFWKPGA